MGSDLEREREGDVPRSKGVKSAPFLPLLSLPLGPYRVFTRDKVAEDS